MTRPTPSPGQLRWMEWGLGAFFHFGINTFIGAEWSDGTAPASLFDPRDLDVDEWLALARRWGARYAILTAKHHDGFCLWPSAVTDYSVATSPWREGRGDLVQDFVDACHRHDIAPGLYLSPWDRHAPEYADPARYRDYYLTQLTELCTQYGPLAEIWFDGAGSEGYRYDWPAIMDLIDRHQPEAMVFNMGRPTIRWVGNEDGLAARTTHYVTRDLDFSQYTDAVTTLEEGLFLPPECDVSVRTGWFWHADQEPKSLEHLLAIHEHSVGRGAGLLLNIPPDRRGRIDPRDGARLEEFAAALQADEQASREVVDGKVEGMVNRIWLHESLEKGQQVFEHRVEGLVEGQWRLLATGTTIGSARLHVIDRVRLEGLRVITDAGRLSRVRVQDSPRGQWARLPEERATTTRPDEVEEP